jgi:hypothetical protein
MDLSVNTLNLLYQLLCSQQISANVPRSEIEAVLTARDELEKALAEAGVI